MWIGSGNRSARRKPSPVELRPPEIPHDLIRAWTRAAAVRSQWLTAWGHSIYIRNPYYPLHRIKLCYNKSSLTQSWSWALLEKPPIVQLLKSFPEFYGTRRFITVFTRALHWSLPWAKSIQSIPPHPILSYINIVHPPTSWSSQWCVSFWHSHQYPICYNKSYWNYLC
jgi:hypothetical protein